MATQKSKKEQKPRIPALTMEGAQLVYRNFSGASKKYNAAGLRNFHVILDPEQAKVLEEQGWNVKWPKPREDGEERNPTLKVWVRFDNYPPYILQKTSRNQVELDEESIHILDRAELEHVALKVTGSYYKMEDGTEGFKAYLAQMFVTISESDLFAKYGGPSTARRSPDKDD